MVVGVEVARDLVAAGNRLLVTGDMGIANTTASAALIAAFTGSPADVVDCIAGTVVKDNADDRAKLRRYFEQRVAKREGAHWRDYYEARHRLP